MKNDDPIFQNPLTHLGYDTEDIIPLGGFGAVVARAGVGKTSFLVQLALNTLSRKKNVLHITFNDTIDKVNLWYKEVFNHLVASGSIKEPHGLWEWLLPNRVIMALKTKDFTIPMLKHRITDLTDQARFAPQTIIIDGLRFESSLQNSLADLKAIAKIEAIRIWFTVTSHRHEKTGPDNMAGSLSEVADLFETIIQLQPDRKKILVNIIKGQPKTQNHPRLFLDPSTLLIQESH
ncbi:MAG: AAA family ATPase [Desulfobacterales bacterium]